MNLFRGIVLLTIVIGSFALDFSRFLWIGKPTKTTEEAQLIEMVRWRQPVCLMPAEGVFPCSHEIKKFQKQYEQFSGKIVDLETDSTKSKSSFINEDKLETIVATPPISEEKSSERVMKTIELTEEEVRGQRLLSSHTEKKKLQQIYVTKVLNSPMTATLVAYGCLPDIGLPLCQNYQPAAQTTKPVFEFKPSLTVSVAEKPVIDHEKPVNTPSGSFSVNVHHAVNDGTSRPQKTKPQIIIKDPSNEESSGSFSVNVQHTVNDGTSRPTKPQFVVRDPNEESSGSFSVNVQHTVNDVNKSPKPQIIVKDPTNEESSTKFVLEETSTRPSQIYQTTEAKPSVVNFTQSIVSFYGQTSVDDHSVETGVSIELSKDNLTPESKEEPRKNGQKILQTIRDIVNKTEHSKIVQSIQNILRRKAEPTSSEQRESSSTIDAGSGKSSNPVEIDDNVQYKDNSNVTKTETASDNGCTSDKMAADQKPIVVEDLRKPLMDGFGEPAAESTWKHGSFGDISKNTKLAEVEE